jgi:hypothetical protein
MQQVRQVGDRDAAGSDAAVKAMQQVGDRDAAVQVMQVMDENLCRQVGDRDAAGKAMQQVGDRDAAVKVMDENLCRRQAGDRDAAAKATDEGPRYIGLGERAGYAQMTSSKLSLRCLLATAAEDAEYYGLAGSSDTRIIGGREACRKPVPAFLDWAEVAGIEAPGCAFSSLYLGRGNPSLRARVEAELEGSTLTFAEADGELRFLRGNDALPVLEDPNSSCACLGLHREVATFGRRRHSRSGRFGLQAPSSDGRYVNSPAKPRKGGD